MLGCSSLPKKTLATILSQKSHFLIQVKGNASKLYKQLIQITKQTDALDTHYSLQRISGRNENRLIEVFEVQDGQIAKDWIGIKRVIKVYRWDDANSIKKIKARKSAGQKSKPSNGIHYYILSKAINNAAFLGQMIRNHWRIENKLHWVKDIYFKEDFMTIIHNSASALVATLNNIAINQIRKYGAKTNKDFFTRITNNVKELLKIVRT